MSDYRCSNCKQTYSHAEYMALDKTSRVTDDPNDKYGVETVCECGKRFHSDKWSLREEIKTDDGEMTVSTVALLIPHGGTREDWYETCIFHDYGSRVVDRYHTESEAELGHSEYIEAVESGTYRMESTGGFKRR